MGRVRWVTTLLCVAAATLFLATAGGARFARDGGILFSLLTTYAFVLALAAGVFVTADALSEEKRTGTLGLLFLTDLNGYDVVLGKFVARALGPFYALCAIVPVTAVSLAMGGVTGGEFWRLALVLLNTLFLSLTAGMWVSARCRESQHAVAGTLALLLVLLTTHAAAAGIVKLPTGWHTLAWLSPSFAFQTAQEANYAGRAGAFWCSLVVTNLIGWLLLALASRKIQSAWQDQPPRARRRTMARRTYHPSPAGPKGQPLLWLLRAGPGLKLGCWGVTLCWAIGATVAMSLSARGGHDDHWKTIFVGGKITAFVLKTVFVILACRFFTDARRSGLLEILLCVPLTDLEIIRAHWRSLWHLFAGPLTLFCAPLFLRTLLGWDELGPGAGPALISVFTGYGLSAVLALNTLTDFAALGWVGMWFAVSLKKPASAPALAMLLVLLLPSFLICVPAYAVNVLFVIWARLRLSHGFRRTIAEQYSSASVVI